MNINKINNINFNSNKTPYKSAKKIIGVPSQHRNQYTDRKVEQIIETAKDQLEINPRGELELLAMMENVGFSNVLEYFKNKKH